MEINLAKIVKTTHQEIGQGAGKGLRRWTFLEKELALCLLWLENEFKQSLGTGKAHEIMCEVHKGGDLVELVKTAIADEEALEMLDSATVC